VRQHSARALEGSEDLTAIERSLHLSPVNGPHEGERRPPPEDPSERARLLKRLAHDILSPTGVVSGALDELKNVIGDAPDAGLYTNMMGRGISRLRRLAARLSMTAEAIDGGLRLDAQRRDVRELIDAALRDAASLDGRKSVGLAHKLGDEPLWAMVDERLVQQALTEVVGNALRHAASQVSVEVSRRGELLCIVIEDDGPGLPGDPERLFNRFRNDPLQRSLGLSLPLVADVLAAHGGRVVTGHSRLPPRRGTRPGAAFSIELPALVEG
jgi:two-component system, OmpR family, sensor histidine kinase MtrB